MIDSIVLMILGAALGWFLGQSRIILNENANLIKAHIDDLESFATSVQAYWLCEPTSVTEEQILATKVKAKHAAITTFYGEAAQRMAVHRLQEYQLKQLRLFRVATGGSFETKNRKIDPIRAIEAYQLSSELVHLLRIVSKEQLSLRTMVPCLK